MSSKNPIDGHLAGVPLFSRLSDKEREQVRSLMTETTVSSGTILAREGAIGQEFFIIVSGTAKVERGGNHLADVGPGDFQGEMSLLDGGPRTATVTATSDMTIMVATQREFSSLLDAAPMIARQMLPALAQRVRALTDETFTN
jgi:CRP/FNR family transcriptional regulator, cyclic AMP receptor protein